MKKVLIIDDEKGFANLLRLNLQQTGEYEVRVENTGNDGLRAIPLFQPDVILLDVIMPYVSGREVAAKLKKGAHASTPIVFLTATVSREDVVEQGDVIDGHRSLPKPARVEEVIKMIKEVLGGN
jgi:two-component system phosphate regulon response regulator PhoB